jgi:hypothetical protein
MMESVITMHTPSPSNGDLFEAPVPEETFPLPAVSPDVDVFAEWAWWPFLVGVITGILVAALAAVIIIRAQRDRNRPGDDYGRVPQTKADD